MEDTNNDDITNGALFGEAGVDCGHSVENKDTTVFNPDATV